MFCVQCVQISLSIKSILSIFALNSIFRVSLYCIKLVMKKMFFKICVQKAAFGSNLFLFNSGMNIVGFSFEYYTIHFGRWMNKEIWYWWGRIWWIRVKLKKKRLFSICDTDAFFLCVWVSEWVVKFPPSCYQLWIGLLNKGGVWALGWWIVDLKFYTPYPLFVQFLSTGHLYLFDVLKLVDKGIFLGATLSFRYWWICFQVVCLSS